MNILFTHSLCIDSVRAKYVEYTFYENHHT